MSNRLRACASPYLQQHADNPVAWQPWDAQALQDARTHNRPILLSVGYAACHWCHVMAHESFECDETAAVMNAHFVNIKVDREERPDIDRIYQTAHALLTRQNGGWPLTMFLTPDGVPFFGGTYFPPRAHPQRPSFREVLARVADAWANQQDAIEKQNTHVLAALNRLDNYAFPRGDDGDATMTAQPVTAAATALSDLIDRKNGGLGSAPKFPHALELAFCLQQGGDTATAAYDSLVKIADSGLLDHLGGGAFRYCVDDGWFVPHFEKMLYDNGQLLAAFAEAHAHQPDARLQVACDGIVRWLQETMRDDQHCFYSSQDADTAGGEGAFYLWGTDELESVLSADDRRAVIAHFGVGSSGMVDGKHHLARRQTVAATAAALSQSEDTTATALARASAQLLAARNNRTPPAIDNKILCAANALAIHGLARAGRLLQRAEWIAAAESTFTRITARLRAGDRTLAYPQTTGTDSEHGCIGFLDDVAYLLAAALELLRARFSSATLATAQALAHELQTHYYDAQDGGFFFTPHHAEQLIRRIKTAEDTATPNGNGVAIQSLLLLSQLTAEPQWAQLAARSLQTFYQHLCEHASGSVSLVQALQTHCHPPACVLLYGDADECAKWQQAIDSDSQSNAAASTFIYTIPAAANEQLPSALQKPAPKAGAAAYVCRDFTCSSPATTLSALQFLLAN